MKLKSKSFGLLFIIVLGVQFIILPFFSIISSSLFGILNNRFDLTTKAINQTLIHTDPSNDINGSMTLDVIDILEIYEHDNMDVVNVTLGSTPGVGGPTDQIIYALYIDSNRDNSTPEYAVGLCKWD